MKEEKPLLTCKETFSSCHVEIFAHGYRLSGPARAVGKLWGLRSWEIAQLGEAALLHDVGKIALPAEILDKTDPLNEAEWELLRTHANVGYHMLRCGGDELARLAPIVRAHHERWDGQGYPLQLVGEAIPLPARILAVADSYDAMVAPRVYRRPLSPAEARRELRDGAGHHYDAQVVEAFLQVLDEQAHANPFLEEGNTEETFYPPLSLAAFSKHTAMWSEIIRAMTVAMTCIDSLAM